MITIRNLDQLWGACCYTPANPNYEAVVINQENPAKFKTCLYCALEAHLSAEREKLQGALRGTNLVSHLTKRLYAPARESLRCQLDDFTFDLSEGETAVVSPTLFGHDENDKKQAFICELAFRVPTSSADFVRMVLADVHMMPWDKLREHFPHRLLSAPLPFISGDGVIITGFTPTSKP